MTHSIRRNSFYAVLLAILALSNVRAIPTGADSCPVITITCGSSETCCCQSYTFAANVSGGYPDKEPTYRWSVSAGRITKGQGTSGIEVDVSGITEDIEVTVKVGGIQPDGCPNPASVSYKTKCAKQ